MSKPKSFLSRYKRKDLNLSWRQKNSIVEQLVPLLQNCFEYKYRRGPCFVSNVKEYVSNTEKLVGMQVKVPMYSNFAPNNIANVNIGYWWCKSDDFFDWLNGNVSNLVFMKNTKRLNMSAGPKYEGVLNLLYVPQTKLVTMPCFFEQEAKYSRKTFFFEKKNPTDLYVKFDAASTLALVMLESMYDELMLKGSLDGSSSFYVSAETFFRNMYGPKVDALKKHKAAYRNRLTYFIEAVEALRNEWNRQTKWMLGKMQQDITAYLPSQEIRTADGEITGWVFDIGKSPWHLFAEQKDSFFPIPVRYLDGGESFKDRAAIFAAYYIFEYQNTLLKLEMWHSVQFEFAVKNLIEKAAKHDVELTSEMLVIDMFKHLKQHGLKEKFSKDLERCRKHCKKRSDTYGKKHSFFELVHNRMNEAMRSEAGSAVKWHDFDGKPINRFKARPEILNKLFNTLLEDSRVSTFKMYANGSIGYAPIFERPLLETFGMEFPASVTWKPGRDKNGKKLFGKKKNLPDRTAKILSPWTQIPEKIAELIASEDILAKILSDEIKACRANFYKLPEQLKERVAEVELLNKNNSDFPMFKNDELVSGHVEMKFRSFDPEHLCENASMDAFGRLYSHGSNGFQQYSGKERLNFFFRDGTPVADVDFKCLHCTLLSAVANQQQAPDDIYKQVKWHGGREQVKNAVNIGLNAASKSQAAYSISQNVNISQSEAQKLLQTVEDGLPMLKNNFCSDAGVHLQWIDSGIILKACLKLQQLGYPAYPVHDSIITTATAAETATACMEQAYMEATGGFKIGMSIKTSDGGKQILKQEISQANVPVANCTVPSAIETLENAAAEEEARRDQEQVEKAKIANAILKRFMSNFTASVSTAS